MNYKNEYQTAKQKIEEKYRKLLAQELADLKKTFEKIREYELFCDDGNSNGEKSSLNKTALVKEAIGRCDGTFTSKTIRDMVTTAHPSVVLNATSLSTILSRLDEKGFIEAIDKSNPKNGFVYKKKDSVPS